MATDTPLSSDGEVPPVSDPRGLREVRLTLDLCLLVGELLLASGAGAADVVAAMHALGNQFGLPRTEVDVTFTSLSMSVRTRPGEPAVLLVRQVTRRTIDYATLTNVDHLVRLVLSGDLSLSAARADLARIISSSRGTARWAVGLGWGVMSAGVALLLGGGVSVTIIAFVAAVAIDLVLLAMKRRRLPLFYQQVAGGMVAMLVASVAVQAGVVDNPSRVVTANIVLLLAGIGFLGAVQDALTGFLVTAGARLTEALLATAGIIAGVGGGLSMSGVLSVDVGRLNPGAVGAGGVPQVLLGGAVCAAAFAFASSAPTRSLAVIGVIAALALGIQRAATSGGLTLPWATALAALVVGISSYPLGHRIRIPPLVLVVPAMVPMLPGLAIYRGLALLNERGPRASEGLLSLVTAASVALALASGAIFGEYVAQPLARHVHKVEARLSGPRLVGPPWPARSAMRRPRSDR